LQDPRAATAGAPLRARGSARAPGAALGVTLTDSLILLNVALRSPPIVRCAASTAADDPSGLRTASAIARSCGATLLSNAVDANKRLLVLPYM